jgi:serine/threonine protein kinase
MDSDRKCTISEFDGLAVWKGVSSALRYLHDKDIVHNDVKPDNIMLRERLPADGTARLAPTAAVLCDFGIATSGSQFATGGTPCYLAPDAIRHQRGRPGDLWALGVTMLFVLGFIPLPNRSWDLGGIPFELQQVQKMSEWLGEVRRTRARLPEKMKLLSGMLKEDPDLRTTASSLCESLAARTTGELAITGKSATRTEE